MSQKILMPVYSNNPESSDAESHGILNLEKIKAFMK